MSTFGSRAFSSNVVPMDQWMETPASFVRRRTIHHLDNVGIRHTCIGLKFCVISSDYRQLQNHCSASSASFVRTLDRFQPLVPEKKGCRASRLAFVQPLHSVCTTPLQAFINARVIVYLPSSPVEVFESIQ